ncbi:MAG: thioesterase family protein [Pseudomonadaceae bacterium]|nr:thioesterase family protein [Pseudomonadaceae bacterium]
MNTSADYLNLQRHSDSSMRFALEGRHTGGRGSLFGGVGLAAGIVALEEITDKPVIWATGHYLSLTSLGETIDLDVQLPAVGRSVTQGRMVGHVGEREVITVIGALGARPLPVAGNWVEPPLDVPAPEDCPAISRPDESDSLHKHTELRLARGMFGFSGMGTPSPEDGRSLLWARMLNMKQDAGALAVIADFMPSCLGNALGRIAYCTSLDNTIRFGNLVDTDWVLCDNRMEYVGDGFGYGTVHLWAQDGTLLATASQSMIVRVPTAEEIAAMEESRRASGK